MTRNAWLVRTIAALACALPLLATLATPATADREDRHGVQPGHRDGHDLPTTAPVSGRRRCLVQCRSAARKGVGLGRHPS